MLDGYRTIWGRGPNVEDLIKFARPYRNFLERHAEAITLVRYEDFMRNNHAVLESALGVRISDDRQVGALHRTRRSGSLENWRRAFTQSDVEALQPRLDSELALHGYDDWELDTPATLPANEWSEYVERIALAGSKIHELTTQSLTPNVK